MNAYCYIVFKPLLDREGLKPIIKKTKGSKEKKLVYTSEGSHTYPEFAAFLVEAGIDSIFLNPDSVIGVKRLVAQKEGKN